MRTFSPSTAFILPQVKSTLFPSAVALPKAQVYPLPNTDGAVPQAQVDPLLQRHRRNNPGASRPSPPVAQVRSGQHRWGYPSPLANSVDHWGFSWSHYSLGVLGHGWMWGKENGFGCCTPVIVIL